MSTKQPENEGPGDCETQQEISALLVGRTILSATLEAEWGSDVHLMLDNGVRVTLNGYDWGLSLYVKQPPTAEVITERASRLA